MQVTYRLEEADYRALAHYLLHQTRRGKLALRRHVFMAVVLSIGAAVIVYSLGQGVVAAALFGSFCFCMMYVLHQRAAQAQVNRIYISIRPSDERRMRDPGTLKLTPEYLEAQYGKGEGKVPWRGVSQVGRDASHVYIILGRVNAFAIPKREFENAEAFEAFYEQAREYHVRAWTGQSPAPERKESNPE